MVKSQPQSLQSLLPDILMSTQAIWISHITNDSRKVQSGSLFIAYQGEHCDGRNFILDAIAKGASAIVYEQEASFKPPISDVPIFPVINLQQQQGLIAARFYAEPTATMQMIGVTGTNGKTSITQFIAHALTALNHSCAVIGTLGNGLYGQLQSSAFTTPDAIDLQHVLAQFHQQQAQYVAMEVSSHGLSMGRVNGVQFDVAVLSQLSRDHLDYHGSMRAYANAKKKLFHMPGVRHCIINIDDELGCELVHELPMEKIITYSVAGKQISGLKFIAAKSLRLHNNGFKAKINSSWGESELQSHLIGRFNCENVLAVLGVLMVLNVKFAAALNVLAKLETVPGRMQLFGSQHQPAVVVDYSHTPDALAKALQALREHCNGKLWCVFGCGGDRDRGKRPQMAQAAEQYSDYVIITNDNPRYENPTQIITDILAGFTKPAAVRVELNRAKAIAAAIGQAAAQDIVLIAGKGHEDYQLVEDKVLPFSDSQEAQQQLRYRK